MSNRTGRFIEKYLQNQKIEMYVGDETDWFTYADNDSMSYVLIVATFKDYDDESGILIMLSEQGHEFYISESKIEMFWKADTGFNIMDTTTSTIRSGKNRLKNKKNRDIM